MNARLPAATFRRSSWLSAGCRAGTLAICFLAVFSMLSTAAADSTSAASEKKLPTKKSVKSTTAAKPEIHSQILFEGYAKVILDGEHVGFVVQRYEFDPKKKEFITVSYLKTNAAGGNITESTKARSSESFRPISFQYTSLTGDKTKTIDGTFKGDTMTAVIHEGEHQNTIQKKIAKDVFLSSFLGYVMLQGKEGIRTGVKYSYSAIAEEDGGIYKGDAYVSGEESISGVGAFKVLNTFKDAQFASWVTSKGEILATKAPVEKVETQLVATLQEATAGQSVNTNLLTALFGTFPRGSENVLARRAANPAVSPAPQVQTGATTPTATPAAKAEGK